MTAVPALLAPIRERAAKATEGPWVPEPTRPGEYMPYYGVKSAALGWNVVHARVDWEGFGHGSNQNDAEFIAAARTDIPRLLSALDGVLALHQPVTYWMTHEDADISYQTKQDALEERTDLTEADLVPFELCGHCKTIEDSPCEGECTMEAGYRESLWPCPTVAAVTKALKEGE